MDTIQGPKSATLCWSCARAIMGGCSWVDESQPVDDWIATKEWIKLNASDQPKRGLESYTVYYCPEFWCDAPDGPTKRLSPNSYHAKPIEDNDGVQMLAAAIVRMACKDYVTARRSLHLKDMRKLEEWFHSTYFRQLSELNPDVLIARLTEIAQGKGILEVEA